MEIVRALQRNERDVCYACIESPHGHDAFLLHNPHYMNAVKAFFTTRLDKTGSVAMNPSDAPIDLFERHDWQTICEWVRPNSRVIDLGCGSGKLLLSLQAQKDVHGYGIEREILDVTACIENGVNVIQTNLNDGLHHLTQIILTTLFFRLPFKQLRIPSTCSKK